ncbi:ABC transporter ATP-binding protein [Infirmifilum sp. SLHALR2]
MGAAIRVKGLSKRFGKNYAIREATFEVPEGAAAALLGPNGAGKTTTIKVLLGLLRPSGGDVEVLGHDPAREEVEVRRLAGVLHEKPYYPPGVTVGRLLTHVARMRGLGDGEVSRVLRFMGLEQYAFTPVRALSRGYLQRLGLAIAVLGEPPLLLLDEPTANLDPGARGEILGLIRSLKEELSTTILISSHIIPELQQVCDYAVFISQGVVLEHGRLHELGRRRGVATSFLVRSRSPREAAAEIIRESFARSVEVRGSEVLVAVEGEKLGEAELFLRQLAEVGMVEEYRPYTASLGELYERVVGA